MNVREAVDVYFMDHVTGTNALCGIDCITLKIKALRCLETSVIVFQSTLRNNSEDLILQPLFIYLICLQNFK
jgi:hypothetical protein